MKAMNKIVACACATAMALALVACAGGAGSSGGSSASSASASAGSMSASSGAVAGELVGSPWVTSVLSGNLPTEAPAAKDDVYLHYNYEYLAAHQGTLAMSLTDHSGEQRAAVTAIIKDAAQTGHDLEQLRIFYHQAADVETLKTTGLSEVQPYLDRIRAITTIGEMNELLTADDFPFSPFVTAYISTNDTRGTNIVGVSPNFLLSDALMSGGTYYQATDDPQEQQNMQAILMNAASMTLVDLLTAGIDQDKMQPAAAQLIDFEKAYGQYCSPNDLFLNADYGAMADAMRESFYTLDELCAYAPNLPLKRILGKLGKDGSEIYYAEHAWIEALNNLWTDEYLDAIKLMAFAKVLAETRPYRDASFANSILEKSGQPVPDADSVAYGACASLDTFADVVCEIYVGDALGSNAKARLEALANDLVATYKGLLNGTTWMSEESKQRVAEKLDHMTLNVLEPQGGYFDYGGLELTPTDQGGTLLSNYLKLKQYRYDCERKLIGQPAVAASPWFQIAPTANNAFYDPVSNSINIYPGYVTSLVYAEDISDVELLSRIGWTIGHEISHGFDYIGSQLDAYGQPNPVFVDADVDAFVLKSSMLALYYKSIEIVPGQMVNGQSVVGEATADLSGMQAVLELASRIEGFDYDKFFASISYGWAKVLPEAYLPQMLLDNHPPAHLRVNVSLQMYDAIYDVLGVAEGDGMYLAPEQRIVLWGPNA